MERGQAPVIAKEKQQLPPTGIHPDSVQLDAAGAGAVTGAGVGMMTRHGAPLLLRANAFERSAMTLPLATPLPGMA